MILAINIIGGLIIGITQHDLAFEEAAETYILLSIGDGLVAQIPSLLLAIATAIIVTRVSSTQDMAEHIGKQINLSRAWLPVSGVLFLIGIVPGMPNTLFLVAGAISGIIGYLAMNFKNNEISEDEETSNDTLDDENSGGGEIDLEEVTDYSPVSIQLGYGLVEMVDDNSGGPLISRITGIRREVSKLLGFVVPPVRIKDDLSLSANQYRIRIGQTIVGEDVIYPDSLLCIAGEDVSVKISGHEVKDPSFGMDAIWIKSNQKSEAESKGYIVITPESVLATHLSQILNKFAGQLIGQDDVQVLLNNLSKTAPNLVESVVPKLVPLHNLTGILRELLSERVPVSDLRSILESLASISNRNLSIVETAEALRPTLAGLLIQQISPLNQPLPVITLEADLEQMLIKMSRQSGEEGLVLDNELAQNLLTKISETNQKLSNEGKSAALVVSPAIRRQFSAIVRQHVEDMIVLAFTELPDNRKINVVASISG